MALPQREEGGGRGGAPHGTTTPGRIAIAARWALVAVAAALALFSAARSLGLLDEPTSPRSTGTYVCPMHPEVASDEPGVCPACGMRLEEKVAAPAASPARAVPVRRARLARSVSAPATIAVPDGRLVSVSVRAQGWIASLPVAEVGRRVERGQVLATVDSPELFRLQQKFLNAVRWSRAGAPNIQPSHAGDSTGD